MKLELYLQQWWGIQNFGRGNFTAYVRVLDIVISWTMQVETRQNLKRLVLWSRQSLPRGLQFTWIARQLELCMVFTGNHGPKERAAKKEIAPRQWTGWTSECQQQSNGNDNQHRRDLDFMTQPYEVLGHFISKKSIAKTWQQPTKNKSNLNISWCLKLKKHLQFVFVPALSRCLSLSFEDLLGQTVWASMQTGFRQRIWEHNAGTEGNEDNAGTLCPECCGEISCATNSRRWVAATLYQCKSTFDACWC